MRILLLLLLQAFVFANVFSQQTINGTIMHGGIQRSYILYVPANYTGNVEVPLVFNFHGYTSNANDQMFYGDFRGIADTAGFIIVHPMGTLDINNTTHFNVGWGTSSVDDVGFSEALLDYISVNYAIDSLRVYSTGMSNGGFMSFELACQLSDRIAAIASVTGSMSNATYTNCNPQHPTPIMQIHGTSDGTVAYNGSAIGKPIVDVLSYWATYNTCTTSPIVTQVPNTNTVDGSTVENYLYTGGNNGATVEHYKVTGGGHTWPGSAFVLSGTNYDMNASKEIWRFFSKYDLNGLRTSTSIQEKTAEKLVSIYPNPTNSRLEVSVPTDKPMSYQIQSITGKIIFSEILYPSATTIDVSSLTNGFYFLTIGNQKLKFQKIN